jgi:hypothetical protein
MLWMLGLRNEVGDRASRSVPCMWSIEPTNTPPLHHLSPCAFLQVIAELDTLTGYLEDKPQGRGAKRTATTANLGGSPITRSRARAPE